MDSDLLSERNQIDTLFWTYLDNLVVLDGDIYVQGNYTNKRNSIRNDLKNLVTNLDNIIEKIMEVPQFIDDVLDFQWLLNCQVILEIKILCLSLSSMSHEGWYEIGPMKFGTYGSISG